MLAETLDKELMSIDLELSAYSPGKLAKTYDRFYMLVSNTTTPTRWLLWGGERQWQLTVSLYSHSRDHRPLLIFYRSVPYTELDAVNRNELDKVFDKYAELWKWRYDWSCDSGGECPKSK